MRKESAFTGMFASFEVVPYRWVWTAALCGNSGRFAAILVAGWEAYRLGHHSSIWPSMVAMLLLIPSMFFGLFAGALADRFNRARMAASGQLVNAIGCSSAGVLAVLGRLNLANLLMLTAVVGIGNSFQGPAWQAMIPQLVGPERLLNASMMTRIAQQGAELTGPAVGTAVLAAFGPGPTFFLCASFYLAGWSMLMHLRHTVSVPTGTTRSEGVFRPIARGFAYVKKEQPLGLLLTWVGLHCSLTMASIGILPAVATANLHGNAGAYGLLLTSFGLGSVIGPTFMISFGTRLKTFPVLLGSGVMSGIPLIAIGLVHSTGVDLVASGLAGAGQAVFMAGIYSATQGAAVDAMRGRVASIQLTLTTGTMGVIGVGWGALVGIVAPGIVMALPGGLFVLACIPFALRSDRITVPLQRRMGLVAAGVGRSPLGPPSGVALEPGGALFSTIHDMETG